MSGFVVMVRGMSDDFAAYGVVRSEERAQAFADWFNARVEQQEAARPDEPDGVAWAYVMPLRTLESAAMLRDSGLVVSEEERDG